MPGLQRSQNKTGSSGKRHFKPRYGNNQNSKNNNQPKMREMKFHLHGTDSSKKAETFEKIREDIISKIKRTFTNAMDIAQSIQDGTKKTFAEPTLGTSTETDPAFRHKENDDRLTEEDL